jgi:hypothetical protein
MKLSRSFTGVLATTIFLTSSACTPPKKDEAAPKAKFTDSQLKALFVTKRPNVVVASPALLARVLNTAPLKEQLIPMCQTSPTATRVIKLRINSKFDLKDIGRDIVSKSHVGGGVKTVSEPTWNVYSTPYDMKLDKNVWDAHNQILAVKVIIKDEDLRFPDDEYSVTTVETANSMFICLDKIKVIEDKKNNQPEDDSDTGQPKWAQATFYVDESKVMSQKFNIRLIVLQRKLGYVMPIILDPVIDNNGFN